MSGPKSPFEAFKTALGDRYNRIKGEGDEKDLQDIVSALPDLGFNKIDLLELQRSLREDGFFKGILILFAFYSIRLLFYSPSILFAFYSIRLLFYSPSILFHPIP